MKRGWDQLERVSVILEGLPYVTFDIHMSAYFFGVLGLKKNVRGAKNALFLSWLRKIRERESRNKILNETFKKELDEIWWASIYKSWERKDGEVKDCLMTKKNHTFFYTRTPMYLIYLPPHHFHLRQNFWLFFSLLFLCLFALDARMVF